ncbi:MAG: antitoxin VapB family protein [Candidatus Heimdallarchaeota archaeon]
MPMRTISINEVAYKRLKALKRGNESFSEVILRYFPAQKKLSEVLNEIRADPKLAKSIREAFDNMRHGRMRDVEL